MAHPHKLIDGIKVDLTAAEIAELNAKDEIENKKIADAKAIYDAEVWKRNRQAEYPSHDDCIHALLDGGDTLTELQAKRTAIKNKYPKG